MEFEVTHHETVYEGRAFDVRRDFVRLPNGQQKQRDVVIHNPSVVIIPLDENRQILFVRQYRHPIGDSILELPAGVMEAGETPLITAQREIREETGMGAEDMKKIGKFYLAPGYSTELMYVYLARGLYPAALPMDEDEDIRVEKVPSEHLVDQSKVAQFRDAKTLAALLLARPYLLK